MLKNRHSPKTERTALARKKQKVQSEVASIFPVSGAGRGRDDASHAMLILQRDWLAESSEGGPDYRRNCGATRRQ